MARFLSNARRPVHLGRFPLETLKRTPDLPDLSGVPATRQLSFDRKDDPESIVNAMRDHQAVMDAIRGGFVNTSKSTCPDDPLERANHIKAFCHFADAAMVGVARLPAQSLLEQPFRNSDIDRLAHTLKTQQTKTLASGIDMVMADLRESMEAPSKSIAAHSHALVILIEHQRDPRDDERGADWIRNAQDHRGCLLASEIAIVLANYIRLLGWDAQAHTQSTSDVCLNQLAVASGLAAMQDGALVNPFVGSRFTIAVVTTEFEMQTDLPLAPSSGDKPLIKRSALAENPFENRDFAEGGHPFETLRRVAKPTTYIDEDRVARVPKRADMFARAQFGEMGKRLQDSAKGGHYVRKAAPSFAQRRLLGAFTLLQDGEPAPDRQTSDPQRNADNLKTVSYFLGADAVGLSACPDWTWYSHDALGAPIVPEHDQAVSMIIDQGFETMEGASGDDWIAVSQSMRAYLRFSLIGGVIAKQLRNLGYKAKAHTVMDGEVLQPPLLLLAGLGEVSRIGEVILNPFLGPRLKSGAVTTDMPMAHDQPIDFGLQKFCESCNKCARECPSGAITAGPKLMFNGYEIWKSDSQKCTTYRVTQPGGAMCGRCMKTCPWNLEGLFIEKPFRWAAMNMPSAAPLLAWLDDALDKGTINPVKKWWWDLELGEDGGYHPTPTPVNHRELQKDLDLKYEDQTLAVYPANLAPHPYAYPFPMNRDQGIEAYQAMITAEAYQKRLEAGQTEGLAHEYKADVTSPVLHVEITLAQEMASGITKYELRSLDGGELPEWTAGAHIDIVVAPEFLRQYSLSGDPADRSRYQIAVLREDEGRGGSRLLHRIFREGRRIFISRPINHFPIAQPASRHLLMGGGIGITPMIAMAHELHAKGAEFELHYSIPSRARAGFLSDLAGFPWSERVRLHVSDEGSRADFDHLIGTYQTGSQFYACGADRYMQAVMTRAEQAGFPDEARHLEYFSVPEVPDYVNHPFRVHLAQSGRDLDIPADQSIADVLQASGFAIDIKCSDGICGVCKCGLLAGEVEHRDLVLSGKQRETSIITCQSRAVRAGGTVILDL
ncbi:2Fe-2S iron-sulfur cluster-binding protein [Sedimentitalea todarodis]|uniref:Reductive dehalogenase domain-containing protein n=1 Tax=Sedimentitalea todarodis TaxID=1631240 RepID=A0ABU3VJT5_9RHOB|nr:reductive dehalogenase domain-containing protein [Sedimentitalea todarodis]MDU9005969.1 reductive dehalogenase domain-containing protein [Sedimentitalea todarodis]